MFGDNIVVFSYGDSTGGREILSEVLWRYVFCWCYLYHLSGRFHQNICDLHLEVEQKRG